MTPEFSTETYGIPREGPYYKTDRPRAFFNLSFCHEFKKHEDETHYAEIDKVYNKLCEIDGALGQQRVPTADVWQKRTQISTSFSR